MNGTARAEWRQNWTVVLAATIGMTFVSIHLYSMGVMIFPIERELGWTRAEISSGLLILGLVGGIASPFVGTAIDRYGPRPIALIGTVAYLIAFAALSLVGDQVWTWWGLWLLVSCAAALISPTVWAAAVSGLFHRSRGLALAVAMSGSGLSIVAAPAVANFMVEHYGWRSAYLGIPFSWACVSLPLIWLFFHGARARQVSDPAAEAHPVADLPGMTAREGFRSFKYIRLGIAACALIFVSGGLIVNLVPILDAGGFDTASAAKIAGLSGFGVIAGRLGGGWMLDRIEANIVAGLTVLLPILTSALLLGLPGSVPAAMAAAVLLGFTLGSEFDAVAYLVSRHFGMRAFGALFGTLVGLINMILGFGPLIANLIYDLTRSYDVFLWMAVPGCLLSSILFLSVGRNPRDG